MAEVDAQAYAVTSLNAAAGASNSVETQQPGGSGALRQVMVVGDSTTRANLAKVTSDGGMQIAGTQAAVSSTAWTSGTTLNTANSISVSGYNTVTVAMTNTSTMTGGVLTFEVSPDNTNWFPIAMSRIDSYTVELTYTLSTVANRAWSTSVDGFTNFRVRLSTVITGTGTATVLITPQTMPIEPIVSVGQATAANLNATVTATNLSSNVAQINGVTPLMGNGVTGTGSLRVTLASDTTSNTNPLLFNIAGRSTGGATTFTLISAATTNATSVKASAGTLKQLSLGNNGAAAAYVKFYNKASAPTVGTDTPVATYYIPATSGREVVFPPEGAAYGTGIAYAITALGTVADTTAVAATQVFISGSYV